MARNKRSHSLNIEDIAERAGVSRSTVSRVLNDEEYVSEETRRKVKSIIEELDYIPHMGARMLRTQRTNVIGVVMPHSFRNVFAADDPHYFSTLLQSIATTAQQRDYALILWVGYSDEAASSFYRRICQNRLMDGMIVVASIETEYSLINNLLQNGNNFVMIGRPLKFENEISYVSVDNIQAAKQAVQHLIKLGKQRIATITGDLTNADARDRLTGYIEAMQAAGFSVDENLIARAGFNRLAGYLGVQQLLHQKIDAIFAASDVVALGAIQGIQEAGLRVPEDISVIGFDDLPLARQSEPQLTTISQPVAQKAEMATTLLLDLIEGSIDSPARVSLPTKLVIRDSCGFLT